MIYPARWYTNPDNENEHRFYDGKNWTDQVAKGEVPSTADTRTDTSHFGPILRVTAHLISALCFAYSLYFLISTNNWQIFLVIALLGVLPGLFINVLSIDFQTYVFLKGQPNDFIKKSYKVIWFWLFWVSFIAFAATLLMFDESSHPPFGGTAIELTPIFLLSVIWSMYIIFPLTGHLLNVAGYISPYFWIALFFDTFFGSDEENGKGSKPPYIGPEWVYEKSDEAEIASGGLAASEIVFIPRAAHYLAATGLVIGIVASLVEESFLLAIVTVITGVVLAAACIPIFPKYIRHKQQGRGDETWNHKNLGGYFYIFMTLILLIVIGYSVLMVSLEGLRSDNRTTPYVVSILLAPSIVWTLWIYTLIAYKPTSKSS